MYNGNAQQNSLCAASCFTKDLPISPGFSPTTFDCHANSVLLSTPLYSSRLYAQNPVFGAVVFLHADCMRIPEQEGTSSFQADVGVKSQIAAVQVPARQEFARPPKSRQQRGVIAWSTE